MSWTSMYHYLHRLAIIALAITFFTPYVSADTFGNGDQGFDIEFVTIGSPGNMADTTGRPNPAGAVDYVYQLGKYEISRDMVTKANLEGGLGISLNSMDWVAGGIRPDMPATGVSWNEAARFANWLNISHGYPAAYKFGKQPGNTGYNANTNIDLWDPEDDGFDLANPFRNRLAHYFLPSVDEWYKAAYYDPHANDDAGGYWDFATGSDTPPAPVDRGTAANTAVYEQRGPADITQAGGLSPLGLMGMTGNVWEWEETAFELENNDGSIVRGLRGGDWDDTAFSLPASYRIVDSPWTEFNFMGFRIARISELIMIGDFNGDGQLDAADINDLTQRSAERMDTLDYDLNKDGLVNSDDVTYWVHYDFGTWLGDANVDHQFTSDDLIQVLSELKYEQEAAAVWTTGDFNGNGRFSTDDLVNALADGGYEMGDWTATEAVPEPTSAGLVTIISLAVVFMRSRPWRP